MTKIFANNIWFDDNLDLILDLRVCNLSVDKNLILFAYKINECLKISNKLTYNYKITIDYKIIVNFQSFWRKPGKSWQMTKTIIKFMSISHK